MTMDSNSSKKNCRLIYGILLCCLFLLSACARVITPQSGSVTEAFRIKENKLIPEGIAYDPADKSFYLGSIAQRKIVRIDSKGKTSDFAVSLHQILGMRVDTLSNLLWACGNSSVDSGEYVSSVYVFSLPNGSLIKKYEVSGGTKHLFNDIVVTSAGDAYVTDSNGGSIYVIRKTRDAIEEFVKGGSVPGANGITLTSDETRILVATASRNGIVSIDLKTREVAALKSERYLLIGYDGIYRYKNSLIGIQNVTFPEGVTKLTCDESFSTVEDVEFLASSVPEFHIPTTGVIVGNYFYFIANSHVDQLVDDTGDIRNPAAVKEPVIMKIRL